MSIDFRAYLDAKFALDSRSLNRDVLEALDQSLASKRKIRCLDLGSGTGATARRLIERYPDSSIEIIGLDVDAGLLKVAVDRLTEELVQRGFAIGNIDLEITARRAEQHILIRFEPASVLAWEPHEADSGFDLITAHAFMDIVPMQPLLEKTRKLLEDGGLFYTTLNYDGQTALIPCYPDESIEQRILEYYDLSMEQRRVDGIATGGAYSGRRLVNILSETGFEVLGYGCSDWSITPLKRRYRDQDAFCLQSLLTTIHAEASHNPAFDPVALERWYTDRCRDVETGTLGMIVHQLDILAIKPHPKYA